MFVLNVKMNEIVNRFLLVGDKFLPQMHLKQPDFTYSAGGPFTKRYGLWQIKRVSKKNSIR